LLDQGVDINRTNTRQLDNGVSLAQGESENSIKVLNNVAAAGDLQLFDHLVARGADVSRSLSLHCASKCQDASSSMIAHLLDRYNMDIHADTDALRDFFRDAKDSGTPLCSAIYHENIVAVEELLKRGADPERCGTSGHRPIVKAIGDSANVGFLPALKPLLKAGVDTASALRCAVDHGRVEAAKICLQAGADPVSALSLAFRVEQSNAHEAAIDGSERNEEARQNSVAITKLSQTWIKE
jgi:ankyrin repeat protein